MRKDYRFIFLIVLLFLFCFVVLVVFNPSNNREKLFLNLKSEKFRFFKGEEINVDDIVLEFDSHENVGLIIPNIDSNKVGKSAYFFRLTDGLELIEKGVEIEIIDNIENKIEVKEVIEETEVEEINISNEEISLEDDKETKPLNQQAIQNYIDGIKDITIKVNSEVDELVYLLSKDISSDKEININYEEVNLSVVGKYTVYYQVEDFVSKCFVYVSE